MTSEDSVMVALGELQNIEEQRIAAEETARRNAEQEAQAAAEAAAKRKADAEAQATAQREHAERVAREEARLNVEGQVSARTKDADDRITAMKAELAAIQAERQAFQLRMVESAEPTPQRSRGWAAAFGIAMVACAALATLVVVQLTTPPPPPRVVIHEVEVPVAVETEPEAAPVVAQVVEAEPEPATRSPRPRNPNRNRVEMRETMRDRHDMAFERMEECGDDPLCMLD